MKRLLLILVISGVAFGQNYSTTFTGTENPLSESSAWTLGHAAGTACSGGYCWGNVQKSGGIAFGIDEPTDFGDPTAILSQAWTEDQAAFVVTSGSCNNTGGTKFCEAEVTVRGTVAAGSIKKYELLCSLNTDNAYMQLVEWAGPNGSFAVLADYLGGTAGVATLCSPGDWFGVSVTGPANNTQIQSFKNGKLLTMNLRSNGSNVTTVTDTTGITGGKPGIGFYSGVNSQASFNGWGITYFSAGQRIAASPSQTDVAAAITAASAGDNILVPPGSGTWTNLAINKAVSLIGAGRGVTNITLTSGAPANAITKQSGGSIWLRDMSYSITSTGGDLSSKIGFTIQDGAGGWKGSYPVIFYNFSADITGSGFVRGVSPGGAIFSTCTVTGHSTSSLNATEFLEVYDVSDTAGSWVNADTMGIRDTAATLSGTIAGTNGFLNYYVEDCDFTDIATLGMDINDGGRIVFRHNTGKNFEVNSHGKGTSPYGIRHFEIYANNLKNGASRGETCTNITNQQNYIWIKGSTGVIYDNVVDELNTSCWGKPEVELKVDTNDSGGCPASSASYPLPHQLGQNHNGSVQFTDPIYLWHNTLNNDTTTTPTAFNVIIDWMYGCATPISGFMQSGRDYVNNSDNTTAKPGYTAYTYPHPLITGTPAAPTYTLTVSKNGTGTGTVSGGAISCGATCTDVENSGTVITLSASPAGTDVFAGWSGGGCSGTGTCAVTLNADTTVTATFNTASATVSTGIGGGITIGGGVTIR